MPTISQADLNRLRSLSYEISVIAAGACLKSTLQSEGTAAFDTLSIFKLRKDGQPMKNHNLNGEGDKYLMTLYLAGLTYKEMAEKATISVAGVAQWVARMRKKGLLPKTRKTKGTPPKTVVLS